MIRGDTVIQNPNLKLPRVGSHLLPIDIPISGELEQKRPVVTSMSDVDYSTFALNPCDPVCPCHESEDTDPDLAYSQKNALKITSKTK
jgi:hypothetical protein